ncbi:hypothetical protein HY792_03760 [Candidatus Desantisbacteria bacterium]|nr:hypothetical protein [Candidatus Desantisbacteria bacterium]
MTTVKVAIPDILSKFDRIRKEEILLSAIRHVVVIKLKEEKKEAEKALRVVKKYEKKYKMRSFEEFEKNMPKDGDSDLHEDWLDWSFYNDVYHRNQEDVQKLQGLLGEI